MRPYLAIVKDSFREALASRAMIFVLGIITLVLLAVAPFSYREQKTTLLGGNSVQTWPRLAEQIRDDSRTSVPSPSAWIMSKLDEQLQEKIRDYRAPKPEDASGSMKMIAVVSGLQRSLNRLMKTDEFYDPESWQSVEINDEELQGLLRQKGIGEEDIARRNRLLIEAAYPELIASSPSSSLQVRYLSANVFTPLPISKARFQGLVEERIVWLMSWFVGVIGVGIALVISSSIVPQTFEPGSLHLLLSKPIQRWLLFLTKFSGGCVYTLITAGYFAVGVWLILGTRFAIWNQQILASVPLFMFLFAINYSVSSLAGVIWRSPILCVILSVAFWLACSLLGWLQGGIENWYINKIMINRVVRADDEMVIANEVGATYRWDAEKNEWAEILESDSPERMQIRLAIGITPRIPKQLRPFGMNYDRHRGQYVVVERNFMQQPVLHIGHPEREWRDQEGVALPFGTRDLLVEPDGSLLAFSQSGLFRLEGDPIAENSGPKLFGFSLPLLSRDPFRQVGPDPAVSVSENAVASISGVNGRLAIFGRATVTLLEPAAGGGYHRLSETKLEIEPTLDGLIAIGTDRLLIGLEDGRIRLYELPGMTECGEWNWEGNTPPRFVTASANGNRFAVVLHNGSLWYLDARARPERPRIPEQGKIATATFGGADTLLVARGSNHVVEYQPEAPSAGDERRTEFKVVRRFASTRSMSENLYHYLLNPLHNVLPKPGELTETLQFVVSGKSTVPSDAGQTDLQTARKTLDPWNPVWSGALFLVVVLGIGCVYMQMAEF